jgi:uncharacterized protein with PhoU and TrkA domain
LHLSGEFRISEIAIESVHWLCDTKLKNTKLRNEGINVIALTRKNGNYLGNPRGDTKIKVGDTLILYGRANSLQKIEKRLKGEKGKKEHKEMVEEQNKVLEHEKEEDNEN